MSEINVYIYDALLNTYTIINDTPYTNTIATGNYTNRFYIAFSIPETDNSDITDTDDDTNSIENTDDLVDLDTTETADNILKINYSKGNNRLKISFDNKTLITGVMIYNYNGTNLQTIQNINN